MKLPGGGTFVLQHVTSPEESCVSDPCPSAQPSWGPAAQPCHRGSQGSAAVLGHSGRAVLHFSPALGWGKSDILEWAAAHSPRCWGHEAALSTVLGFWSKSGCKLLLLHVRPSLNPGEEVKIFLCPKLFLKWLLKCFPENAEADWLRKNSSFCSIKKHRRWMYLYHCHCRQCVRIFFSVFETKGTYIIGTMMYYPKKSVGSLELVNDHGPKVLHRELSWKVILCRQVLDLSQISMLSFKRKAYIFLIIKSGLDYIYKSITYVTKGTVDVSIFAKFKNASSAWNPVLTVFSLFMGFMYVLGWFFSLDLMVGLVFFINTWSFYWEVTEFMCCI